MIHFSHCIAIIQKEIIQLKRDILTLAMIIIIPLVQIVLFGYAIDTDPKHLSTAVVSADHSFLTRSFIAGLKNSSYFDIKNDNLTQKEAHEALLKGDILMILNIPADFTRNVLRGKQPEMLLEVDATDPTVAGGPVSAVSDVSNKLFKQEFKGTLKHFYQNKEPFAVAVHLLYNPEKITQYNIIPGLIGTILSFSLTIMTSIAITRERERGTMEQLLAMPVRSYEVLIGKIIPYILIGLLQGTLIIVSAKYLFDVPFFGSLLALYTVILLFISVTIAIGVTLSSFSKNQMQSMQFTIMTLLPSILLSGFMFPFEGMPRWAQYIGNILPLTYFIRLTRAIMLKGSDWYALWPNIWPLCLMLCIVLTLAITFYKKTLD